jgi:hypothetical protein
MPHANLAHHASHHGAAHHRLAGRLARLAGVHHLLTHHALIYHAPHPLIPAHRRLSCRLTRLAVVGTVIRCRRRLAWLWASASEPMTAKVISDVAKFMNLRTMVLLHP